MASPIRKLLSPGDVVYHITGKKMVVKSVGVLGFTTDDDFFSYLEHRKLYFLTARGLLDYREQIQHPAG